MSHPLGDCYGTNHRRVPRAKGVFFVEYVADGVGWGGFVLCEACWKIYDRSAKVRLTAESREEIEEWFGSSPYAECRMCAELVEIGPEEDEVTQEWWHPEEDPIADLADDPELQALVESALAKARAVALEMEDRDRVRDLISSICLCNEPKPGSYMGEKWCSLCRKPIGPLAPVSPVRPGSP